MPRIKEYKLILGRGHVKGSTVVPTNYLKDWLEPKLMEIGKSLSKDNTNIPDEGTRRWNGAMTEVTNATVNQMLAHGPQDRTYEQMFATVFRRICGILKEESDTTDLGVADAIILACGSFIGQTDIPVIPAGRAAALEMVECHNDITEAGMTQEEIKTLAYQLERFTIGFSNGPLIFGDAGAKGREQKKARDRQTRATREFKEGIRPSSRRGHSNGVLRIPRRTGVTA